MEKRHRIAKTILKKNKVGGHIYSLPNCKTYYKATVTRLCCTSIRTDIRINGKDLRVQKRTLHLQSTDFQQGVKTIQQGKNSLFNKWCQDNWIVTCKEKNEFT
jgi:hypothetical protein